MDEILSSLSIWMTTVYYGVWSNPNIQEVNYKRLTLIIYLIATFPILPILPSTRFYHYMLCIHLLIGLVMETIVFFWENKMPLLHISIYSLQV